MTGIDWENFQPLRDGVVVRVLPQLASDVITAPEIAEKASHVGVVVSVGPGKRYASGRVKPVDAKPGDKVWFSLNDLEDNGYALITEGDIGFRIG